MLTEQEILANWQKLKLCIKKSTDITDWLLVSIVQQKLYVICKTRIKTRYPVSTSKYGPGNQSGSYQTPLGVHKISEKIGADQPINMIFQGRKPTGLIANVDDEDTIKKDIITSRILWLDGQEEGINRGGRVDSYQRYIYIHGTANEDAIGSPASIGCIRMNNSDVIALFEKIKIGTPIIII